MHMLFDIMFEPLEVRGASHQVIERLGLPKLAYTSEHLVDLLGRVGLPAVCDPGEIMAWQWHHQNMDVIAGYGKAPQPISGTLEMQQRFPHDTTRRRVLQCTGTGASVQPLLHADAEKAVILSLDGCRQFEELSFTVIPGPGIPITTKLLQVCLSEAVRLPPCHEMDLARLFPVRSFPVRDGEIGTPVEEEIVDLHG